MKIMLFGPLPSENNFGGPESITYNLSIYLSRLGYNILVVNGGFGSEDVVSRLRGYNIEVSAIPRFCDLNETDVIHVILGLKSFGFLGGIFSKIFGKHLISHFHHDDRAFSASHFKYSVLSRLDLAVNKYIYNCSDFVISVSNESKKVLKEVYGVDSIVIPLGVDTEQFNPDKRKFNFRFFSKYGLPYDGKKVLFVGNLVRRKGLEYLIYSFKDLREGVSKDVYLIIIGDGPEKSRLMDLTSKLRLDNVYFLGNVPQRDLPIAYASSDLFAFPTLGEGFGLVLIEAMASGIPVVSTRYGGVSEVIENEEVGLLVPKRNVAALTSAITELLLDDEKRAKMGEKGRSYVKRKFNWEIIARKIGEVYERVLL